MSWLLRKKDPWKKGVGRTYHSKCGKGWIKYERGIDNKTYKVNRVCGLYLKNGESWVKEGVFQTMEDAKHEFHKRTASQS